MKISANRDDLLRPLQQVVSVVERRQTLPILANVLIAIENSKMTLTATDLEVELRTQTQVEAKGEAEFTLPARKFLDICKALPDGAGITIDIDSDKATIRSGRGRYTLGMLPAQDYPNIEPAKAGERFSVSVGVLKRLIEKTQFAMAQQDVRYYLNGLLLEIRGGRVRAVATDGHRLALCDATFDGTLGADIQVILPRKAVTELGRLLDGGDDEVNIEISASHIRVNLADTSFTSKLIDGRFPDYERVMPNGETAMMLAAKDVLRQALARTAILSNEKYRGIRFRLSSGLLHLQAHNPEQDEAEEEIEVDYGGPELTIGFNVGYLLDVLGVLDGEEVEMAVIDSNSSALLTHKDSTECRYVVMPMRL
ncbi:MAG: DNA polymerase III subunit beta [Chromatiaceae bacterium]|nr:DNA polymerase III subunit beta [Gammaproteobacteria bacterium]MCP5300610.1 DNA polymerase III subunit beta [Chromatiaceae bacterium]MCP5422682.1 DNA polymerase III subunit beta [Chromatiaceae bacterium]